jgi:hypothetical protein
MTCHVQDKVCNVIIDSGSFTNIANIDFVQKRRNNQGGKVSKKISL